MPPVLQVSNGFTLLLYLKPYLVFMFRCGCRPSLVLEEFARCIRFQHNLITIDVAALFQLFVRLWSADSDPVAVVAVQHDAVGAVPTTSTSASGPTVRIVEDGIPLYSILLSSEDESSVSEDQAVMPALGVSSVVVVSFSSVTIGPTNHFSTFGTSLGACSVSTTSISVPIMSATIVVPHEDFRRVSSSGSQTEALWWDDGGEQEVPMEDYFRDLWQVGDEIILRNIYLYLVYVHTSSIVVCALGGCPFESNSLFRDGRGF